MAVSNSFNLRRSVFSRPRLCRASCCVIVLHPVPPCPHVRPRATNRRCGRDRTLRGLRSSMATTARIRCGDTSARGTSILCSLARVNTGRSSASYRTLACAITRRARISSRFGTGENVDGEPERISARDNGDEDNRRTDARRERLKPTCSAEPEGLQALHGRRHRVATHVPPAQARIGP
jgi:hypothetical protein